MLLVNGDQEKFLEGNKCHSYLQEREKEQLHLNSQEGSREVRILKTISKHIKDRKVTGTSQHEFMKGKSRLLNSIAFYCKMTGLVDEGRKVDVVYLNYYSKAFSTVPRHVQ